MVETKKIDEYRYNLYSHHSQTHGSNNYDIDTITVGIYNFLKNDWEKIDIDKNRYKL